LRQYIGAGKTAVNLEKISKGKIMMVSFIKTYLYGYGCHFFFCYCVSASLKIVASGSLLTASTLLSLQGVFLFVGIQDLDLWPKIWINN
jgi:hypothetical protein